MRWLVIIALFATACSLDWSLDTKHSSSGGSAGTSSGGTSSGGTSAGGTSGTAGTGGIPPSGGGAPGGAAGAIGTGGMAGDCSSVCVGVTCNTKQNCGGGTILCCADTQVCASPDGTQPGLCMPKECVNGSEVACNAACPDICGKFSSIYACCGKTGLCYDTSNTAGCQ